MMVMGEDGDVDVAVAMMVVAMKGIWIFDFQCSSFGGSIFCRWIFCIDICSMSLRIDTVSRDAR